MKEKTEQIPTTLNLQVQLKDDEVKRFLGALNSSVFAGRRRVKAIFARHLILEQINKPSVTTKAKKAKAARSVTHA